MTKMRRFILFFFFISFGVFSQKQIETTNEIKIFGQIDNPQTIPFLEIEKEKSIEIGDFTITNHLGEFRKVYKNLKGVSLLTFLEKIKIQSPSPKELSEYYFIFKASDGYSVVFSWNEIFNTDVGKSIFIATEADNNKFSESSERILLISTKDYKTGRRHIKGLSAIEIKKI